MHKITLEWGSEVRENPDFEQQEFECESYTVRKGCLIMKVAVSLPSGFIWEEIGVATHGSGLRRWYVGEGVSYKSELYNLKDKQI